MKAVRGKPTLRFRNSRNMDLLQTDNAGREVTQPLHKAQPFVWKMQTVCVKSSDFNIHCKGQVKKEKHQVQAKRFQDLLGEALTTLGRPECLPLDGEGDKLTPRELSPRDLFLKSPECERFLDGLAGTADSSRVLL